MALPRLSLSIPREQNIDFIDNEIKLRVEFNTLLRLYHLVKGS